MSESYEAKSLEELNAKIKALWTEGSNMVSAELTENEIRLLPRNSKGELTDGWIDENRVARGRLLPIPHIDELDDAGLDYFVETFELMWQQNASVKEIMEELQFEDKENTEWNGELKPHHVYYFVKRLGLPPRHKFQKDE